MCDTTTSNDGADGMIIVYTRSDSTDIGVRKLICSNGVTKEIQDVYLCDVESDENEGVEVTSVEVMLDYEMHTLDTTDADTELPSLQAGMLAHLANAFGLDVEGCTGFDVDGFGRALAPLRRRRLQEDDGTKIVGLAGTNPHTLDPDFDCLSELDPGIPSTDCSAIKGRFTASFTNTDEAAIIAAISQALEQGMDNNDFISTNVPAVTFIGTRAMGTMNTEDDTGRDPTITQDPILSSRVSQNASSAGALGIGLASAFGVCVLAFIVTFLRRKNKAHQQGEKLLAVDLESTLDDSDEDTAPNDLNPNDTASISFESIESIDPFDDVSPIKEVTTPTTKTKKEPKIMLNLKDSVIELDKIRTSDSQRSSSMYLMIIHK
uniref:Uncharacterized protein n=1 Tax=Ditylum brightwellii TaxID=49249 RepID=A0A7S4RMQ3_9STRA